MSATEVKIGSKQSQHFANGNCDVDSNITSSTKDVFEGQVLIDRLLLYYSKFEGSREQATRYAQKLLDLGHIECLTNGITFKDSARVYRWTDANKVVNEAKTKAVEQQRKNPITVRSNEDVGKAILKISIETDNCQAAEIQANIKASPRTNGETHSKKIYVEPKSITTVEEDSFFGRRITKTLSYLSDGKTEGDSHRSATPYITDVTTPPRDSLAANSITTTNHNVASKNSISHQDENDSNDVHYNHNHNSNDATKKTSFISDKTEESHSRASSPRKKLFNPNSSPLETKQQLKNIAQGHKAALLSRKSATEPVIAKELSPGTNGTLETQCKAKDSALAFNHMNGQTHLERGELNLMHSIQDLQKNGLETDSNTVKPPKLIASTQTSEKSILEASRIYNGDESQNNGKGSPSPAPRRRTLSFTDKQEDKNNSSEEASLEHNRYEIKTKELQRVNQEKQQRKTRFSNEILETSSYAGAVLAESRLAEWIDW